MVIKRFSSVQYPFFACFVFFLLFEVVDKIMATPNSIPRTSQPRPANVLPPKISPLPPTTGLRTSLGAPTSPRGLAPSPPPTVSPLPPPIKSPSSNPSTPTSTPTRFPRKSSSPSATLASRTISPPQVTPLSPNTALRTSLPLPSLSAQGPIPQPIPQLAPTPLPPPIGKISSPRNIAAPPVSPLVPLLSPRTKTSPPSAQKHLSSLSPPTTTMTRPPTTKTVSARSMHSKQPASLNPSTSFQHQPSSPRQQQQQLPPPTSPTLPPPSPRQHHHQQQPPPPTSPTLPPPSPRQHHQQQPPPPTSPTSPSLPRQHQQQISPSISLRPPPPGASPPSRQSRATIGGGTNTNLKKVPPIGGVTSAKSFSHVQPEKMPAPAPTSLTLSVELPPPSPRNLLPIHQQHNHNLPPSSSSYSPLPSPRRTMGMGVGVGVGGVGGVGFGGGGLGHKTSSSSFSTLPSPPPESSPSPSSSPSSLPSPLPSPLTSPLPPSLPSPFSSPGGVGNPPLPPSLAVDNSAESREEREKIGRLRMSVLKEIIDTEQDYITDIQILITVFKFPIQATNIIPPADLLAIFSNIEDVFPIHETFLKNLMQKLTEQKESGGAEHEVVFGDIFVRFFHYFKLYSIYASNQNTSLAKLEEWSKKKEFDNFLKICHSDEKCKGQFLNSFLIKPIQRLCKYPLLLRELIKYTPESHPDASVLIESMEKVNSVVNFVNEAKRKEENLQRMRAIADKFGIKDLVREDRILMKEGKVFQKKGGKIEDRYLFVFNDLILVMKPSKRGNEKNTNEKLLFKKIASADLSRALQITAKIINIADLPEKDIKSAFEVGFDGVSILFTTSTEKEKTGWVKTINTCIKEFQRQAAFKMKKELEAKKKVLEEKEREKKEKEEKRKEDKIKAKMVREAIPFEAKKTKMEAALTNWAGNPTIVNEDPEQSKKKKMEEALSSWSKTETPATSPKRRSTLNQSGENRKSYTNLLKIDKRSDSPMGKGKP